MEMKYSHPAAEYLEAQFCLSLSIKCLRDVCRSSGVDDDRKIPHHRFNIDNSRRLPICFSVPIDGFDSGYKLKVQSPLQHDHIGIKGRSHVQRNRKRQMRLQESNAEFVMFGMRHHHRFFTAGGLVPHSTAFFFWHYFLTLQSHRILKIV